TGDVVNMLAQVPAILQAVTGLRMDELMARIPGLSNTVEATPSANGANAATSSNDASSDSAAPVSNETPPADGQPPESEPVAAPAPSAPDFSAAPVNGVSPSGATRGPRRQRSR
ncbi:MAG TPA: hypothetical protein VKT52_06430, partial [Ktedonobacterales bacterium]|nr:hypothetical protein [Ktedonobacterales bacterium]